jgi:hypothetical protein
MPEATASALAVAIRGAYDAARTIGEVTRDDDARAVWGAIYPELARDHPGLAGALLARGAPLVLRLALVYALLDQSAVIRPDHLNAALALWDYNAASIRRIFGDLTGDALADRIVAALRTAAATAPDPMQAGLTQTELSDLFGRNVGAGHLGRATELLLTGGRIRAIRESTTGRPVTRWVVNDG